MYLMFFLIPQESNKMKFGNIKMKPDKSKEFIIQKKIAGIKK